MKAGGQLIPAKNVLHCVLYKYMNMTTVHSIPSLWRQQQSSLLGKKNYYLPKNIFLQYRDYAAYLYIKHAFINRGIMKHNFIHHISTNCPLLDLEGKKKNHTHNFLWALFQHSAPEYFVSWVDGDERTLAVFRLLFCGPAEQIHTNRYQEKKAL